MSWVIVGIPNQGVTSERGVYVYGMFDTQAEAEAAIPDSDKYVFGVQQPSLGAGSTSGDYAVVVIPQLFLRPIVNPEDIQVAAPFATLAQAQMFITGFSQGPTPVQYSIGIKTLL